jgi:hypothetical protein
MKSAPLVRGLVWGLAAVLLLPIVLSVTLGTGSLLGAVGDSQAAAVCRRVALGIGMLWITALAATTVVSGIITLVSSRRRPRRRRVGRRKRPRPPRTAGR